MEFEIWMEVEDLALKVRLARDAIAIQVEDMVNSNDLDRRDALGYAVDAIMADIQTRADALEKGVMSIRAKEKSDERDNGA